MRAEPPFWEGAYRRDESPFGAPSDEVVTLMDRLPAGARVLDLGCGDGRHAIPLALAGHHVTGVDVSSLAAAAVERAARRARAEGHRLSLDLVEADLAVFPLAGEYDLIIAHGVLHLLRPRDRDGVIAAMQDHTAPAGWNVVAAFTDEIPPPEDLAPFCVGLFRPGELVARYRDWDVELERAYILEDEHPGGIRHRHPVTKVVARRPT